MSEITAKFKEVLSSVLPITFIVLILHFTISPLEWNMFYAFLLGSVLVIIGLTVFLFGIDQGLEPIGQGIGNSMTIEQLRSADYDQFNSRAFISFAGQFAYPANQWTALRPASLTTC